jgi:hypothetical protein
MKPATHTIDLHTPRLSALHGSLMGEYKCALGDIIRCADTEVKQVALFVLSEFYGYDNRALGYAYSASPCFVPTIVARMRERYVKDNDFQRLVQRVLNDVDNYEA